MFSFGRVPVEKQLETLATIGVRLNPNVSLDDMLLSFPREDFERKPYDLVLFVLGSEIETEPWGRHISGGAWNFAFECIEQPGSYARILRNLTRLAKRPALITDIGDDITADMPAGVLSYTLNDEPRSLDIEVQDDWADGLSVAIIMGEIADAIDDGRKFWGADNGQAVILFFLTDDQAARINRLRKNALKPM